MNSYPPELLAQLAPVMFVAGLDAPNPQLANPPTTPVIEPEITVPSQPPTPSSARIQQDPFVVLTLRLRDALLAQRKVAVWQPEKAKTFQVVLVDKVRWSKYLIIVEASPASTSGSQFPST